MPASPMRMDYANRLIDKFEPGGQGIGFARISRADVVDGLRARVQDPVTQNQLAAGLCGPASLFYTSRENPAKRCKYHAAARSCPLSHVLIMYSWERVKGG